MFTYADPMRCPDCRVPIDYGAEHCGACGIPLRGDLAQELFTTLRRADALLVRLRTSGIPMPARAPAPPRPLPPAPAPAPLRSLRASSVPRILLGLGAGCLLVAALVFLAVTWPVLGVGGRTVVLVLLTGCAASATDLVARRALRGGVEALGAVTLGFTLLDLAGGRHAGWLDAFDVAGYLLLMGTLLAAIATFAALHLRATPARGFVVGELAAGLGIGIAAVGLVAGNWASVDAKAVSVTLATGSAAYALVRARLLIAGLASVLVAGWAWAALVLLGIGRLTEETSWHGVWHHGWVLLTASALLVLAAAAPEVVVWVRRSAWSTAATLAAVVAVAPALDEGADIATYAVLACLVVSTLVLAFAPRKLAPIGALTGMVGATWSLGIAVDLTCVSLARLGAAAATPGRFADRLPVAHLELAPWQLVLAVAGLCGFAAAVRRFDDEFVRAETMVRVTLAMIAVSVLLTAALYPLPVLAFVGVGLAAGLVAAARQRPVASAACLSSALVVATHATGLTAVALLAVLAAAAWTHVRRDDPVGEVAGGVALLALAGLVWTFGSLLDLPGSLVGAAGIVVVLLVPVVRPSVGVEVGAATGAFALFVAGLSDVDDLALWSAVYLTLAGALVCLEALVRADRRELGWVGGVLLAAATWVRLGDVGVHQPEAYTVPSALALLTVGVLQLRRRPESTSMFALGPALGLALTPSLLWSLAHPHGARPALLGLACLVLVLVAVRVRWTAPLVYGATVGAALVLRMAGPHLGTGVPRWVLIGCAGTLLVALGVTWEERVREARLAMGYVRDLR